MLRDAGHSYLAYTEQITFLLFLKIADDLQSALDQFAALATDLKVR